jgi:type I restriction enzyme, R subunit
VSNKELSEADICDRFITPAIQGAGWAAHQWRREYSFTDGKQGHRARLSPLFQKGWWLRAMAVGRF